MCWGAATTSFAISYAPLQHARQSSGAAHERLCDIQPLHGSGYWRVEVRATDSGLNPPGFWCMPIFRDALFARLQVAWRGQWELWLGMISSFVLDLILQENCTAEAIRLFPAERSRRTQVDAPGRIALRNLILQRLTYPSLIPPASYDLSRRELRDNSSSCN